MGLDPLHSSRLHSTVMEVGARANLTIYNGVCNAKPMTVSLPRTTHANCPMPGMPLPPPKRVFCTKKKRLQCN
jgi:hypothetical protein